MYLSFIARGYYGLAAPSASSLSRANLLALLVNLVDTWVGFCLGRGCWVGVTMVASAGLLNFCRCCALRLDGKSQFGSIPICVYS